MKSLIIGHSHRTALLKAKNFKAEMFDSYGLPDRVREVDTYCANLVHTQHNNIFILNKGNHHNVFGLTENPVKFDFYFKGYKIIECKSRAFIPQVVMYDVMYEFMLKNDMLLIVDVIRKNFNKSNLFCIESPPPFSEEHINNNPGVFREKIKSEGIAPLLLRLKLWKLHSQVILDYVENLNIKMIRVPNDCQNEFGTLKKEYCSEDPTHGNYQYGELVINQIIDSISDNLN